jgi:hypothetical protein
MGNVPPSTAAGAIVPEQGTAAVPNGAGRETAPAETGAALPAGQPLRWDPAFWSYPQHAALRFDSEADLDAAIDLLWNDRELRGLPRVHVGDNTLIVPADAVDAFRKKARHFVVQPVVSAGDLSPEEANRYRRGTGD